MRGAVVYSQTLALHCKGVYYQLFAALVDTLWHCRSAAGSEKTNKSIRQNQKLSAISWQYLTRRSKNLDRKNVLRQMHGISLCISPNDCLIYSIQNLLSRDAIHCFNKKKSATFTLFAFRSRFGICIRMIFGNFIRNSYRKWCWPCAIWTPIMQWPHFGFMQIDLQAIFQTTGHNSRQSLFCLIHDNPYFVLYIVTRARPVPGRFCFQISLNKASWISWCT